MEGTRDELREEIAVLFFMWNTCFHDKWNICPSGPLSLACCVLMGPVGCVGIFEFFCA